MARYRLIEPAFLQQPNVLGAARFEAGAVVTVAGAPSLGMVPLDEDAALAKADAIRARINGGKFLSTNVSGTRLLAQSVGASASANAADCAQCIMAWITNPAPFAR